MTTTFRKTCNTYSVITVLGTWISRICYTKLFRIIYCVLYKDDDGDRTLKRPNSQVVIRQLLSFTETKDVASIL